MPPSDRMSREARLDEIEYAIDPLGHSRFYASEKVRSELTVADANRLCAELRASLLREAEYAKDADTSMLLIAALMPVVKFADHMGWCVMLNEDDDNPHRRCTCEWESVTDNLALVKRRAMEALANPRAVPSPGET